jgi:uncharacterized protein (DUF2147 family)
LESLRTGALRAGAIMLMSALGLLVVAVPRARAADDPLAAAIIGNWLTQKHDGIIRITRSPDGTYQGQIVGGDDPGRIDAHNPDPALRDRSLIGQILLQDMQYDGQGHWSGGSIYDPDSGHTYRCRLEMRGADSLRVRGFLGVSVLGRSQLWTRYRASSMQLPTPAHR